MSYSILLSPNFQREAKRLVKKYASLKNELTLLFSHLENDPTFGTPIGGNVYKIRIAIASKGKGRSGGARVLTFVKIEGEIVLVFSIYDKSEKDNLSDSVIKALLKDYK
jgi:mRNA-degrading endonuclease RelE of RelBE toxin-antitoxin system